MNKGSSFGLWLNYPIDKFAAMIREPWYAKRWRTTGHVLALGPIAVVVIWRTRLAPLTDGKDRQ